MDLEQLIATSGMARDKARTILEGLRDKGFVSWDGKAPAASKQAEAAGPAPWDGMEFNPFDLKEDVDLDERTKKKILYLHKNMESMSHYDVLEVGRRVEAREIKRAYFNVSRQYHPDSYFRKNLGSYKPKVEDLFKRITRAYEFLSDPERRKAYDATLPYEPTPEERAAAKTAEQVAHREEDLKKERRERLMRRGPWGQRKAKAHEHYLEAKEFWGKKNPLRAANCIRMALALDPDSGEYQALLEEVESKAGVLRADTEYKHGRYDESVGKQEEALRDYLRAIEAHPADGRSLFRAAALMLDLKRDLRQALTFCRKAHQLDPENNELLKTLAELYLALGMVKNAAREFTRYLDRNPLDEGANAKLKELKKQLK
jgi:curved DNA-binding protein CbpA